MGGRAGTVCGHMPWGASGLGKARPPCARGSVPASLGAARAPEGEDKRGLLWLREERARESKQSKGLSGTVTALQLAERGTARGRRHCSNHQDTDWSERPSGSSALPCPRQNGVGNAVTKPTLVPPRPPRSTPAVQGHHPRLLGPPLGAQLHPHSCRPRDKGGSERKVWGEDQMPARQGPAPAARAALSHGFGEPGVLQTQRRQETEPKNPAEGCGIGQGWDKRRKTAKGAGVAVAAWSHSPSKVKAWAQAGLHQRRAPQGHVSATGSQLLQVKALMCPWPQGAPSANPAGILTWMDPV